MAEVASDFPTELWAQANIMLHFGSYYSLWFNCTGHCITLSACVPFAQLLMFIPGTSVEYNVSESILDIVFYSFLGLVCHYFFLKYHSNNCI